MQLGHGDIQRLGQAAQPRGKLLRYDHQHACRANDVAERLEDGEQDQGADQGAHAFPGLAAHQGHALITAERKDHGRPQDGAIGVERQGVVGMGEMRRRPVPTGQVKPGPDNEEQQGDRQGRAENGQPLPHTEASGVHEGDQAERQGCGDEGAGRMHQEGPERRATGQACGRLADQIDAEEQKAGEIGQIARPVQPAAHEAGEVALRLACPGVDGALFRKARRQFQRGDDQGHQEEDGGQDPDRQGDRPGRRPRRQPADGEVHRGGVEGDRPEAGFFRGTRGGIGHGRWLRAKPVTVKARFWRRIGGAGRGVNLISASPAEFV